MLGQGWNFKQRKILFRKPVSLSQLDLSQVFRAIHIITTKYEAIRDWGHQESQGSNTVIYVISAEKLTSLEKIIIALELGSLGSYFICFPCAHMVPLQVFLFPITIQRHVNHVNMMCTCTVMSLYVGPMMGQQSVPTPYFTPKPAERQLHHQIIESTVLF